MRTIHHSAVRDCARIRGGTGATFGVLYALWENDPAWRGSGLGSGLVLVGAGLGTLGRHGGLHPIGQVGFGRRGDDEQSPPGHCD